MSIFLTLGQAAKQYGVAKGTLSKAIATGKLSATRNEDQSWKIDPAEMARYWSTAEHRFRSETVVPDQAVTLAKLAAANEQLERRVADLKSALATAQEQCDKWEGMAHRLSLPGQKRSWWRWKRAG